MVLATAGELARLKGEKGKPGKVKLAFIFDSLRDVVDIEEGDVFQISKAVKQETEPETVDEIKLALWGLRHKEEEYINRLISIVINDTLTLGGE